MDQSLKMLMAVVLQLFDRFHGHVVIILCWLAKRRSLKTSRWILGTRDDFLTSYNLNVFWFAKEISGSESMLKTITSCSPISDISYTNSLHIKLIDNAWAYSSSYLCHNYPWNTLPEWYLKVQNALLQQCDVIRQAPGCTAVALKAASFSSRYSEETCCGASQNT